MPALSVESLDDIPAVKIGGISPKAPFPRVASIG
jgi:hypothetical protein